MYAYEPREQKSLADISQRVFENPRIAVGDCEMRFEDRIRSMSESAVRTGAHIILLTGPSSSGKTTTADLLVSDLAALGRRAVRISLDDFYKDRKDMPLWEDGSKNFESVDGLDLDCFHECTNRLLAAGHADFPVFDFENGVRSPVRIHPVDYDENTIIIYEGIHSLDPKLREGLADRCYGIYIHPNTNFTGAGGEIILEARDLRLTRRIIRDALNRGTDAMGTLRMWKSVLRGEFLYIIPNSRYADVFINTCHDYEPFLYAPIILEMLSGIREPDGEEETIHRLKESFRRFFPISSDLIPPGSLIQEFIRKDP